MAEELDYSQVERLTVQDESDNETSKKPSRMNFFAMVCFCVALDVASLFGIGLILDIIYVIIMIPWFHFSGMKFTRRRASIFGITLLIEALPVISIMPMYTVSLLLNFRENGK